MIRAWFDEAPRDGAHCQVIASYRYRVPRIELQSVEIERKEIRSKRKTAAWKYRSIVDSDLGRGGSNQAEVKACALDTAHRAVQNRGKS